MLVIAALINVSLKSNKTSTTSDIMDENPDPTETTEVETASSISASTALAQYELERKNTIQQELDYLDELINAESTDKGNLKNSNSAKNAGT